MGVCLHAIRPAVLLLGLLCVAHAREIPLSALNPGEATLANPLVIDGGSAAASITPVWAGDRLWTEPASDLDLARFERHGAPVWDPSTAAWYVWANGAVVRIDGARAVVVADGVLGRDLDVRAGMGVAVSREPDHAIVLWDLNGRTQPRRLLQGARYLEPRLSPDGASVLIHEARAEGGHLLIVSLDQAVRDLGPGSDGAWTPDGAGVVFTLVSSDGERVVGADLYCVDLTSGRRTRLTATSDRAEVEPALSPDGRFIAYQDALSGRQYVARMPSCPSRGDAP